MAHHEPSCPLCGNPREPGGTEALTCHYCGLPAPEPSVDARQSDVKESRPGRTALVAALSVLVIGIACAVSYPMVRDALAQAQTARAARTVPPQAGVNGPPAGRAVSDASDAGEVRTGVVLLRVGKAGAAKSVVALGRPTGPQTREVLAYSKQATLLRELVRQALLIAARDELGLPTRDEVIEDGAFDMAKGKAAELDTVFRAGGTPISKMTRHGSRSRTVPPPSSRRC
jgi:hypothetical protein